MMEEIWDRSVAFANEAAALWEAGVIGVNLSGRVIQVDEKAFPFDDLPGRVTEDFREGRTYQWEYAKSYRGITFMFITSERVEGHTKKS